MSGEVEEKPPSSLQKRAQIENETGERFVSHGQQTPKPSRSAVGGSPNGPCLSLIDDAQFVIHALQALRKPCEHGEVGLHTAGRSDWRPHLCVCGCRHSRHGCNQSARLRVLRLIVAGQEYVFEQLQQRLKQRRVPERQARQSGQQRRQHGHGLQQHASGERQHECGGE